jgi:hypothetical protein
VVLVAVTALAVLVRYPAVLADAGDQASQNSALSYADREVAGGNGLVADQSAVYAARALIPQGATFDVAVSPSYRAGSDLTVGYVASYYRYALMPRRMAGTARWVVCYACDVGAYGSAAKVVWKGVDDISILRVER